MDESTGKLARYLIAGLTYIRLQKYEYMNYGLTSKHSHVPQIEEQKLRCLSVCVAVSVAVVVRLSPTMYIFIYVYLFKINQAQERPQTENPVKAT